MLTLRALRLLLVMLLLATTTAVTARADTQALPDGWRLPAAGEITTPGRYLRAEGDFNGDGRQDYAMVLLADHIGSGPLPAIGFFAWLSQSDGGSASHLVRIFNNPLPVDFEQAGLATIPPGRYVTACGAGHGDGCAPGEPAEVVLATAGIQCCLMESVSGLLWWNPATQQFDSVPYTD